MSENNCRLVRALLGIIYKATALSAIGTVIVTLDVQLSLAATAAAFSIYYGSRALCAVVCPEVNRHEHRQVVSELRPSKPVPTHYPANVTPFPRERVQTRSEAIANSVETRKSAGLRG